MDNRTIAQRLVDYAHYLENRRASLYRVKAYRRAAETVLMLPRPVAEIVAEAGRDGLEALPGIGDHLSFTIETLVRSGEFRTVDGEVPYVESELFSNCARIDTHPQQGIDWQRGTMFSHNEEAGPHQWQIRRSSPRAVRRPSLGN
jgi:DNA polymerase/3'-5' exonuclease PolX